MDTEIGNRTTQDNQLQNSINTESTARQAADTRLENLITDERNRALGEEVALKSDIEAEESRATVEEQRIDAKLDQEIADRIADVDAEEIRAKAAELGLQDSIDQEILDDEIKIENGKLVIVFNTDAGKETIEIPLSDIFNPDNYYNKSDIDGIVNNINTSITNESTARESADGTLQSAITAEQARAEAVEATKADKSEIPTDFYTKGEIDGKENALQAGIDANAAAIEAEELRALSAETDLQEMILETESALTESINLKADADTVYTQDDVDALLLAKENEIYNLTKIVGDMGGAVTYEYPNEAGKSLTTLLGNNGTVKLGEDATITRFGPGVTAKNTVKLNLNNNDLTSTSAGSYGAIMSRGTQNITIYGKGTINAGDGICIEANGASSVINLTGSTTIYHNNRSGAELIYCYAGTINITNGTFRNDGEDKKFVLNCYDANYTAGTAKIIVTGGKFYDFDPGNNTAEGPGTSFLAEGYHTEPSTVVEEGVEHTVYTVKKDA